MLCFGLEFPRAVAEGALFASSGALLRLARPGDGHPVLVLPGFLADDRSTVVLRHHLRRLGHTSHSWRLGRNIGPTKAVVNGLEHRLDELAQRYGQPSSIVGWSLGGIYARELARRRPDLVRTVITLGSPFRSAHADHTLTGLAYERYRPWHLPEFRSPAYVPRDDPLSMPSTAIYTRSDGVVAWRTCVQRVGPTSENIEVFGSHCGLGHNPAVLYAIGDRLAQPVDDWRPFRAPCALGHFYRRPVTA
jgi:pimeloyl-ACP methyl ester carboxylesterase